MYVDTRDEKRNVLCAKRHFIQNYCINCEHYHICPLEYKCDKMKTYIDRWMDNIENLDNDYSNNGDQ